jgi:PPE-repeat protein
MATSKKLAVKDIAKQVQPLLECLGGIVVGNLAVNMANKALKIDPNDTTKNIKKVLPPVIVMAGSLVGMVKVKQPMLKNVLQGAALAGAIKTAKVLMPTASFLNGDDLGLTPVSAASNAESWVYQPSDREMSGIGFPDLGNMQPPESGSGYYIDAPAYFQGTAEEQMDGAHENGDYEMGEIEIL